jgi:hypothetical protein
VRVWTFHLETDVAFRLIRDSRAGDARRHRFSKAFKQRFSQSAIQMTPVRRADDQKSRWARARTNQTIAGTSRSTPGTSHSPVQPVIGELRQQAPELKGYESDALSLDASPIPRESTSVAL